ncbi:hypothetical protein HDU98_007206 [Podochytrium sp. JEL0797]|nr:hypothetical protein HDU98_007206 [Podochytrium sp. JEL0797]
MTTASSPQCTKYLQTLQSLPPGLLDTPTKEQTLRKYYHSLPEIDKPSDRPNQKEWTFFKSLESNDREHPYVRGIAMFLVATIEELITADITRKQSADMAWAQDRSGNYIRMSVKDCLSNTSGFCWKTLAEADVAAWKADHKKFCRPFNEFREGDLIAVKGLVNRADLNGSMRTLMRFEEEKKRWHATWTGLEPVLLKVENMERVVSREEVAALF